MNKQNSYFSFNIPLELSEKWMIGVTSLEVYNTVYNISGTNNKLEILVTNQRVKEHAIDTQN